MAKANEKSSTIGWVWLHDALVLATESFGGMMLAKKRLKEWLASGQLPWSCIEWAGLDAERIAWLEQQVKESIVGYIFPSAAYLNGDPAFWRANLDIRWEENEAERGLGGANALGIKVSREHLLALLPEEPRERVKTDGPLPAASGAKKTYSRLGSQMRRVLPVLKKLYPPNGEVPDEVSTEAVRARVNAELAAESRNQERAAPSWDTINRALGRG